MSKTQIRLLLDIEIHHGQFSEFEAVARQMVAVSKEEPGTLLYSFFLSADCTHCRLIEAYTDVPAITAHFEGPAVQQFVPQMLKVANLIRLEMYGDPGPKVKAMAAKLNPALFANWHGFDR